MSIPELLPLDLPPDTVALDKATKAFYAAVEKYIAQHTPDNQVSKELENLASRLRHSDREYIHDLMTKKKKLTLQDVLHFAYKILVEKE